MYAYKSNPVLPDSDFDGRDDIRDRARALLNDYTFDMDTLNNNGIHFDFTMDYRYFFMDSSYYYYELSDMSLALANMIGNNKQGNAKSFENRNKDERYRDNGIRQYMWYTGFDIEASKIVEDIEEYINYQSGSKVYWITGFGSGGSIANLVGQKLTDKKGVENVYCYTFESYPTINANNLQTNNNTRFSRYTNTLKDKKKILNGNIDSLKNTIIWQFTREEYDVRKPLFE